MILSKIERLKDKRRYDLYIDGEPILRVHEEVLIKFGLQTGVSVGTEILNTLKSSEEFILAKYKAMEILNRRIRSEKELRAMLRNKEFHPHTINMVITHLNETGILDDQKFARTFAHYILSRKPAGKALLQRELRLKGLNSAIIHDVIQETLPENEEEQLALKAAHQALKRHAISKTSLDATKRQQKLSAHLARRGFSWGTISTVMKKLSPDNSGLLNSSPSQDL